MATVEQLVKLMVEQMRQWMEQRRDCCSRLRALSRETRRWELREILGSSAVIVGPVLLAWGGLMVIFSGYLFAKVFSALGFIFMGLGTFLDLFSKIKKKFRTRKLRKEAEDRVSDSEDTLSNICEKFDLLRRCLREDLEEDEGGEEEKAAVIEEILSYFARRVGFIVDDLDFWAIIESYIRVAIPSKPSDDDSSSSSSTTSSSSSDTPSSSSSHSSDSSSQPSFLQDCVLKILKVLGLLDGKNLKAPVKASGKRMKYQSCDSSPSYRGSHRGGKGTSCVGSESQRNMADRIQKEVDELQEAMQDISFALEELRDVLECIEDPGCVCRRTKLVKYAQRHCRDPDVRQWIQEEALSEQFLHLVDVFQHMKAALHRDKEKKRRKRKMRRRLIDVVFVAHGCIADSLMCSDLLLPLPSLQHLLLYEPWNCDIDSTTAYGIATGFIQPEHRAFECGSKECLYFGLRHSHYPNCLPPDWNHLQAPGGEMIPEIWVETLRRPVDAAWREFKILRSHCRIPHDRVVVPFILPKALQMPFHVVTLALSVALLFSGLKARLHLAACLGYNKPMRNRDRLQAQYCYAPDHTVMKCTPLAQYAAENLELYNLLKDIFG